MTAKILVIDDSPTLAAIISDISDEWDVRGAYGPDAVAVAHAWQPDVITLDLLMPGLDGWIMRDLLANDTRTKFTPVIVLTGIELTVPQRRALRADAIVDKPFDVPILERALLDALEKGSQTWQ